MYKQNIIFPLENLSEHNFQFGKKEIKVGNIFRNDYSRLNITIIVRGFKN